MKNFVVVGYFTRNTFYEDHTKVLVKSLDKYKIPYYIEGIESLGDWYKNVNYQPTFILKMMKMFPSNDIVSIDCDAEFFGYPELFEEIEEDIAIHLFDQSHINKKSTTFEVLSGTIFLKNNERTYKLMKRWEELCIGNADKGRGNQKALEQTLNGNFYNLPESYCKICNARCSVKYPIIVHYQASRTMRRNKGRLVRSNSREMLPPVMKLHLN